MPISQGDRPLASVTSIAHNRPRWEAASVAISDIAAAAIVRNHRADHHAPTEFRTHA